MPNETSVLARSNASSFEVIYAAVVGIDRWGELVGEVESYFILFYLAKIDLANLFANNYNPMSQVARRNRTLLAGEQYRTASGR